MSSYTKGNLYVTYKYNADGLRTEKNVVKNGVETNYKYTWSDNKLVHQVCGNENLHFYYDSNDEITGFSRDDGTNVKYYSYVKNIQGDITGIIDESGNSIATYSYDAWGVFGGGSGNININPIRYRGYYYDNEIGMYYLQSRYYNPKTARFLNADDTDLIEELSKMDITDTNIYSYCKNNAANYLDPEGMKRTTKYTIKYISNGGLGSMSDTIVTYGKEKRLRKNSFTRKYYDFKGWHAKRKSDNKWLYTNGSTFIWYKKGTQPNGYSLYLYKDGQVVSKSTKINKDIIYMYAIWQLHIYKKHFNHQEQSWLLKSESVIPTFFIVKTSYLELFTKNNNSNNYYYRSINVSVFDSSIIVNSVNPMHVDSNDKTIAKFKWVKPTSVIIDANVTSHKDYYNNTNKKYNYNSNVFIKFYISFIYKKSAGEYPETIPPKGVEIKNKLQ